MKIKQPARRVSNLKTRSVTLRILGGDKDYSDYCEGCGIVENRMVQSRRFKIYNPSVTLKNVVAIDYFDCIGSGVAIVSGGQVYRWTTDISAQPHKVAGMSGMGASTFFVCTYAGAPAVGVLHGVRLALVTKDSCKNLVLPVQVATPAMYMGRVFAADGLTLGMIRWSGDDVTDWKERIDGSGHLTLPPERGKIFGLFTLGDKLVVFREYGLDIIKAYGDPRHMTVTPVGSKYMCGKLTDKSGAVCGDSFYFCGYKTIYRFDGENISIVPVPEYMNIYGFTNAKCIDNRYLFFKCRFLKDYITAYQYELEIDVLNNSFMLDAPDKICIWKEYDTIYAFGDGVIYHSFASGYDVIPHWRSKAIDLDIYGVKTLKTLRLETTEDCVVTVNADGVERSIKSRKGKFYLGLQGKSFTFSADGKGSVNLLEAEWEVRE